MKVKGVWDYLYRAIDKHSNTLDWMLSRHRNKKAAKRFFKKVLGNGHVKTPRVMNVDSGFIVLLRRKKRLTVLQHHG